MLFLPGRGAKPLDGRSRAAAAESEGDGSLLQHPVRPTYRTLQRAPFPQCDEPLQSAPLGVIVMQTGTVRMAPEEVVL